MKELSIDIETYSSEDLLKTGVYRYAEAPDFTILLFAYAFDDEDIQIVDLASGEALPEKLTEALTNPKIIKTAYNANFERTTFSTTSRIWLENRTEFPLAQSSFICSFSKYK